MSSLDAVVKAIEEMEIKWQEKINRILIQLSGVEEKTEKNIAQLNTTLQTNRTFLESKVEAFTGHSILDKSFRFLRFQILKNRAEGGYTQIGKLMFRNKGVCLAMTGAKASTTSPIANGGSEGPEHAINYNSSNKWCSACSTPSMVIEFPREVCLDQFTFTTANDCPERDPKQWLLEGSNDASNWTTLHYQKTDFYGTEHRNSGVGGRRDDWFSLSL